MRTSESTTNIGPAWVAALNGVHNVTKDASGHHGKYATLSACLDAVKPVLQDLGLAVQQYATTSEQGSVTIVTRVWHESGEWIEDEGMRMPAPNDPQKVGGSVTYGRRYSLTTFFAISTEDDDGQSASDAMKDRPAARPQQTREPEPEQPRYSQAARTVFDALKKHAGTPAAEAVKQMAQDAERKLTLNALNADDEWCNQVAEKLADELEFARAAEDDGSGY